MTEQPQLFKPPAPTGKLTDRQLAAYEYVRDHDGVTVDEVGAIMHGLRRSHHPDNRCEWCAVSGLEVLTALRSEKNGRLVVHTRADGLWRLRHPEATESAADASEAEYDPSTSEIPF